MMVKVEYNGEVFMFAELNDAERFALTILRHRAEKKGYYDYVTMTFTDIDGIKRKIEMEMTDDEAESNGNAGGGADA